MENSEVIVIDYGMGNILSVLSALRFLGATAEISSDPEVIVRAKKLLLPGVGSFRRAMDSLTSSGLAEAICRAVNEGESRLLGICLGMQLLGTVGTEDGETSGLGLVDQRVDAFTPSELAGLKSPHIGFSAVRGHAESRLFSGLPASADFYFVHSYRMLPEISETVVSPCLHGMEFAACVERGNVFGTQFHPEKSQTNGLLLLRNFLNL